MQLINDLTATFATLAWGPWLVILLIGGGLFFLIYSGFTPFNTNSSQATVCPAGAQDEAVFVVAFT